MEHFGEVAHGKRVAGFVLAPLPAKRLSEDLSHPTDREVLVMIADRAAAKDLRRSKKGGPLESLVAGRASTANARLDVLAERVDHRRPVYCRVWLPLHKGTAVLHFSEVPVPRTFQSLRF
jgi:hypothetical protein